MTNAINTIKKAAVELNAEFNNSKEMNRARAHRIICAQRILFQVADMIESMDDKTDDFYLLAINEIARLAQKAKEA